MICRDKRLPFDSEPQGDVLGNPRLTFDSSQTPYQGILHSATPSAAGAVPVQGSTGTPVERGEERVGSTTTLPMSERRPSTMNSLLSVGIPKNSSAGQQRQQISELQFDKLSTPSSVLLWNIRFKNRVSSCSDFPSDAMSWIKEVEMVDSVDDLKPSRSTQGYTHFPNFEMLDARFASGGTES